MNVAPVVVGSEVVAALEYVWRMIQAQHPEVPDVTLSLGFVRHCDGVSYGRNVIVTFDALKRGAECVVGVLVHEAAHQALRVAGARDWHRHRGTFTKVCARFGLDVVDAHPRYGSVTLSPYSEGYFVCAIERLAGALP